MAEGSPNPNANMLRNIIVGVATSVLGAGSLYFLGINKSGSSGASSQGSFLEIKEATTKGWKSYVTDDNIYYKNQQSVFKDLQRNKKLDEYQEHIIKEMDKFDDDVESILKDPNLDNSFVTMLKRREDLQKELKEKLPGYITNVKAIMDDNTLGQYQRTQKLQQEDQNWYNTTRGIIERGITQIEDISKVLTDKYGQSFAVTDILVYQDYKKGALNNNDNATKSNTLSASNQQQDNGIKSAANVPPEPSNTSNNAANNTTNQLSAGMYAGEWTNEGGSLYFDNKGFSWEWNDGKVTSEGNWRAEYNQLTMYVTRGYNTGYSWTFNLSNVTANSFTMQLSNNSNYTYHMVKYTGQ